MYGTLEKFGRMSFHVSILTNTILILKNMIVDSLENRLFDFRPTHATLFLHSLRKRFILSAKWGSGDWPNYERDEGIQEDHAMNMRSWQYVSVSS